MAYTRGYFLPADDDMIEVMEGDLATKCAAAMAQAGVTSLVNGVFSLDQLEAKLETDLCGQVGVGVGYSGAKSHSNPNAQLNPGSANAVKHVDFTFAIILAVPTGAECVERYSATKILTILRRRILGSKIDGDTTSRTWAFVAEGPNITESTDTMLFYTQQWVVNLPNEGPKSTPAV